ncbi:hypothetical protein Hamer_G009970, partial [Homarus americanus]
WLLSTDSAAMPSDALMPLRVRHAPPMFVPPLWNVHDATMNNNARTNNICEGWNNKFFNLVGHYHPSIWRREEATVSTIIQQDAVGNPPQRRVRRRDVQLQERLRNFSSKVLLGGNKEFPTWPIAKSDSDGNYISESSQTTGLGEVIDSSPELESLITSPLHPRVQTSQEWANEPEIVIKRGRIVGIWVMGMSMSDNAKQMG